MDQLNFDPQILLTDDKLNSFITQNLAVAFQ